MKYPFISIIIFSIILSTVNVGAQTTNQNRQILQRFQPNASIQTNNNRIGGVNFSGVSGSILACSGVGKSITNALSGLGQSNSGFLRGLGKALGIGGLDDLKKVPTTDSSLQTKVETANKKEGCLDAIAYTLAKQALGQVTNKTLNWVNTGFGGNPFYTRNIDSFLGSIKNEQVRDYIRIAENINSGNGSAVGNSVTNKIIEMVTGRRNPAANTPITEREKQYDSFTKDFSSGGWDAWYRMTQLGENPIGEVLNVSQQLGKNIGQQQESIKQELSQGNGFLSQKQCVEWAKEDPDDSTYFNQNADGSPKCLKYETVTPGSVIAAQTQTITNSGTRQLEAADELNEVLGAFFDSLLNSLFNKGLQTLGRNSSDNFGNTLSGFGGSGSNIVTNTNGQPINGTGSGVVLPFSQSENDFNINSFNITNIKQIEAIIKAQKDFLSKASDSQASLQKIVPNLGKLDYCIPGPHQSWEEEADINSQTLFNSIRSSGIPNYATGSFKINDYELFDPLKNTNLTFTDKRLEFLNSPKSFDFEISDLFNSWYESYKDFAKTTYSPEAIANAFIGTETSSSGKSFARGFVSDSLNETSKITDYITAVVDTDTQYETAIEESQKTISELESIRRELIQIVTVARNRHIANKKSQGITVNMTCLNQAYDISNKAINGAPREESDATDELNALEEAQANFYNNL